MLSIEAYKSFLLKINKNDTNSDIDITKGEFVLLYNEQKDVWLSEGISNLFTDKSYHDVSELLVKHVELVKSATKEQYDIFEYPEDLFDYVTSYSICSKDGCGDIIVRNFYLTPEDENTLLENVNYSPDIEFEETVVDLSGTQIFVYKKDFNIDKVFLTYYREVGKIDIAGYRKVDGTQSTDIHPDVSDMFVEQIINRCAKEVIRRYENPDGFQLAQERIATEK